jgi:hypothetical protein
MTGEEATVAVIEALKQAQISYMLVGSFSSNFYGIPRGTQDADFVIQLEDQPLATFLDKLGPGFGMDPQMSFELITGTTRHKLQVQGTEFEIELFRLSDDPHDQERFRRRYCANFLGRNVFLPTAEDVIITKLRWAHQAARAKDWEDIRNVIAVQGDRIDWDYVLPWCDQHGTRELLDEIRRSIPPI